MFTINDLKRYSRLALGFRGFLKETLTLEQCKEIVKKRLEERDKNFLNIVKKGIYRNEGSPYLKLLNLAGCEYGDIESSIAKNGIENTLQGLRESGVYLTYEEFKGRKEVSRGGETFRFKGDEFDNPNLSSFLEVRTGGTTGEGVSTFFNFEFLAQTAVHQALLFDIYKLWEVPLAFWVPILPGSIGVGYLLRSTKVGKPVSRWFSQIDREYIKPLFKYRLRTNSLIYLARLFGAKLPKPEYVDLESSDKIAQWAAQMIKDHSGCCIMTYPSSAVRICLAAKENGLDIEGVVFIVIGEPLTPAKQNEIKSLGAEIIPQYGFTEGGYIGFGCSQPEEIDEIHFFKDSYATIQHKRKIPPTDLTVNAFLFTSLLPQTNKILLNVEVGDYGMVESRKCGCGFEAVGLCDHIHSIRSFDKLTSEGMSVDGVELIKVIEEVFPQKYGGYSTDYQVIEEEDKNGFTRLSIIVSPRVGEINEEDFINTLIGELKARYKNSIIPEIYTQAGIFLVKRIFPIHTEMGKTLPFYIQRGMNPPGRR